ncbi:AraC family transcriptional regulator [Enterococcus sp. LJL128]
MINWLDGMNKVVMYIENHLDEEIDYEELGKILGYSTYHMQRLFLMVAGVSISEYIRCRRLSKAAHEIISGSSVTDTAYRYGYSSPTSFSRAFKAMHEVTPKDIKKGGVMVKAYPPLSFELSIKGANTLNYRIVQMDGFKVVGKKIHTTMENGMSYQELPKFWQQTQQSGEVPAILSLMDREPMGLLGISDYNPKLDESTFDYYIGAATSKETPDGFFELTVPAATWAAFPHKLSLPEEVQQFQKKIVTEWLPTSGYQFAFGPDIEVYGKEGDMETWIPVTPI